MTKFYDDYRGVDNLVYAKITQDDSEGYATSEVKPLIPAAEISKSTESSSATKYYDNKPAIVINSEGADEISITGAAIPIDVLADITGKIIDATTGAFIDVEAVPPYVAIGYQFDLTSGEKVYIWRNKGKFGIPDESSATRDDGTDSNGQELTFTGISTDHKFTNGHSAKGVVADTRFSNVDESKFFKTVCTPDTFAANGVTIKGGE
jgi:phi13 family phage major tail protein